MNLSYWEYKSWISNINHTIVGSGIVGLSCALALRKRFPQARILVLEKGYLPQGASTKNAGFACFGSISEILDDLKNHTENEVIDLIQARWEGMQELRKLLGDERLKYESHGGYELFTKDQTELYEACFSKIEQVNALLAPIFGESVFSGTQNTFGFKNIEDSLIWNRFEGQLDTGEMMRSLLQKVRSEDIIILNGIRVLNYEDSPSGVILETDQFEMRTRNLYIATNGFARDILKEDVAPARAQVLITKPIPQLNIQGTFHTYKGFTYFRNENQRILIGGGRHLDLYGEETISFGRTEQIQNYLKGLLKEVILPDTPFEIEREWSGIMGVGKQKRPIIKALGNSVYCGVRLGGMGVAIGISVGKQLAQFSDA